MSIFLIKSLIILLIDRRHFDNPVYAYQGVPLNGASTSLNNTGTKHIHNDLGMKSNLAKAKLGDEDSDTYTEKGNTYCIIFILIVFLIFILSILRLRFEFLFNSDHTS